MGRAQTLELLTRGKPILTASFGVARLALFGSAARDAARTTSDLDLLVTFDGPATADRYFGVQFCLEDLLGRLVDLVTDSALRSEMRPFVERDARYVRSRRARQGLLPRRHDRLRRVCRDLHRRSPSGRLRR